MFKALTSLPGLILLRFEAKRDYEIFYFMFLSCFQCFQASRLYSRTSRHWSTMSLMFRRTNSRYFALYLCQLKGNWILGEINRNKTMRKTFAGPRVSFKSLRSLKIYRLANWFTISQTSCSCSSVRETVTVVNAFPYLSTWQHRHKFQNVIFP